MHLIWPPLQNNDTCPLRINQKFHKIIHDSIENRGNTPILTNLVGVHPRNIHTEFEANPCFGLREVKNGILVLQ